MNEERMPGEEHIDLFEESVQIDKTVKETARIHVRTFVDEEQVLLKESLTREIVDVERVAIEREVATAPLIREEGDFLIVPIVEERLVVEKRLFLVEEVRLHRSVVKVPVEATATRRVMRAEIKRDDN